MKASAEVEAGEDLDAYIRDRLPLRAVPFVPEIRIHTADPRSGLHRLAPARGRPPYWAYAWAGGGALARHILDDPALVAGRRVLDFGAGSGIVGIAAALAGASEVTAAEIDPVGASAARLNAAANGVTLSVACGDPLEMELPAVDLVAAGDVFYDKRRALRSMMFLQRCHSAGIAVLVGDPGREWLPLARLRRLASYRVADFGDAATEGHVYTLA